tara:strand:+ start:133 stop:864 length:732 start_codon:yes stop_codon:yes gene_type:complete
MKRFFDIFFSIFGILIISPFLFIILFMVWKKDKSNPLYIAKRVGKNGKEFNLIKIRTMIINADKNNVDSTSVNDKRITKIGSRIRKYKIDELPQLFNIFLGHMSFVGPRPNVRRETNLYTDVESKLLKIKPGITDFASIIFSDEGSILEDSVDPDLTYNQLIRPGKSKLGLFYLKNNNILIDVFIILNTLINPISRKLSLKMIVFLLFKLKAPKELLLLASRKKPLTPLPPPGSNTIVSSRNI